ncbi:MAG: protein-L-isoaspartate(D-aspartate) O-methyltransferase [Candidatus Krumholzibacteria bacterium]|nr:protein-L-isoaspartate(D-aspartate) O-methyltransferase [Candidatus Krumholzibacteria bacterium]
MRPKIKAMVLAASAIASLTAASAGCSTGEDAYARAREAMVRTQIAGRGISDALVLEAMLAVPRHRFVPARLRGFAYVDNPLPIGLEQTISQPYIVALMTESLRIGPGARVLEVGTGSGYQAAVLAEIADSVFTIEIIPELAASAAALLDSLGYDAVIVRAGDGFDGWPAKAPFDGIIVTAAAPEVPPPLAGQLADGGRLVIPIGDERQDLHIYEKTGDALRLLGTLPVRFVPMTGKIRSTGKE